MTMNLDEFASVVGKQVKLRKVAGEYRGRCPFHHGSNDTAFCVFLGERGEPWWYCHNCGGGKNGKGGSVIDWLMIVEKKTFREAGGTSISQDIRKQMETKKRRERKLDELYDRQPECVIPDWGIET